MSRRWFKVGSDSRTRGIGSKHDLRALGLMNNPKYFKGHLMDKKQEQELIAAVIAVGQEFKPLHKKLSSIFTPEVRAQIESLKTTVFNAVQGTSGQPIEVNGKTIYWSTFVVEYFGVSTRRINQLLDNDEARNERRIEIARQRRHPEECPEGNRLLHKERVMHRGNGDFEQVKRDALEIVKLGHQALLDKGEAPHPLQNSKDWMIARLKGDALANSPSSFTVPPDPYAYFEQFKGETQTMGDEISAMLIEFGLDTHQIKEVLRYAEMSAQRTLQQLQVPAAA